MTRSRRSECNIVHLITNIISLFNGLSAFSSSISVSVHNNFILVGPLSHPKLFLFTVYCLIHSHCVTFLWLLVISTHCNSQPSPQWKSRVWLWKEKEQATEWSDLALCTRSSRKQMGWSIFKGTNKNYSLAIIHRSPMPSFSPSRPGLVSIATPFELAALGYVRVCGTPAWACVGRAELVGDTWLRVTVSFHALSPG